MKKIQPIGDNIEKAISILVNTKENSKQKNQTAVIKYKKKPLLEWLPERYKEKYESTDLLYSFCVEIFSKIESNMREDIPETTMRSWFIEFIKAGWTKVMVQSRYEGLIRKPKFGSIDFSNWVNAVPVYAEDEIMFLVGQRMNAIIQKGEYLIKNKDKILSLTDEEKRIIEVTLSRELEAIAINERLKAVDDYKDKRREELRNKNKSKA
jgi:hypothetical protein